MTPLARQRHSELLLACLRAEAQSDRLTDTQFRAYLLDLTSHLDLPDPDTQRRLKAVS